MINIMNAYWLFVLLLLISVVVSYFISKYIERESYKIKMNNFLPNNKIDISFIYEFFSSFGRSQQTELKKHLENAGFYNSRLYKYYFSAKYGVLSACLTTLYFAPIEFKNKIMLGGVVFCLILVLPDFYLHRRKQAIANTYRNQLPYLIDITAVCLQTGMTIESTSQIDKLFNDALKHSGGFWVRLLDLSKIKRSVSLVHGFDGDNTTTVSITEPLTTTEPVTAIILYNINYDYSPYLWRSELEMVTISRSTIMVLEHVGWE